MSNAAPSPVPAALRLALGPAIALGLGRFAYALLLPPMREDLGWTYLQAGALNTFNAVGYLVGAFAMNQAVKRFGARRVFVAGTALTTLLLLATGLVTDYALLSMLRLATGIASGLVFAAGGLIAARLGGARSGLVLGLYYGGVGIGLVASAWIVPATIGLLPQHGWQGAWIGLAALALAFTVASVPPQAEVAAGGAAPGAAMREGPSLPAVFAPALLGYLCYGFGYIGYMTFDVALFRQRDASPTEVTAFFTLVGLGALAGSRGWSRVLETLKGGRAFAVINTSVGIAALLPLLSDAHAVFMLSGFMFGGGFLAVVAATTALVRHSLAPAHWPAGIGLFTTVFAAGQIIGPVAVGKLSDSAGGLEPALTVSAVVLLAGSVIALAQRTFSEAA